MFFPAICLRATVTLILAAFTSGAAWCSPLSLHEREAEALQVTEQFQLPSSSALTSTETTRFDAATAERTQDSQSYPLGPGRTWDASLDLTSDFNAAPRRTSAFDALRGVVDVPSGGSGAVASGAGRQRPPETRDGAGMQLGADSRAWLHEAVRGIVESALELRVDRGSRGTFSILGLGDFSLGISSDRAEIEFDSGEDVLFSAHRAPYPMYSHATSGHRSQDAFSTAASPSTAYAPTNEHPLKQALELAAEVGTHPISMLVYVIIAIYALLWSVLSRQPRAPRHAHAHHARAHALIDAAAHATTSRTGRKRRRFRRHRSQ
jgi:hypothetical protein